MGRTTPRPRAAGGPRLPSVPPVSERQRTMKRPCPAIIRAGLTVGSCLGDKFHAVINRIEPKCLPMSHEARHRSAALTRVNTVARHGEILHVPTRFRRLPQRFRKN